jgi:hypothetical protein
MQRISSNATLFFKFVVPVFWLVFFGAFLLAIFLQGAIVASLFANTGFRIGAVLFYLSGIVLFYFTLFPLKRVEADIEWLYVTNYFKTYRYSWDSIESVTDSNFLLFTAASITLKAKGEFGQKLPFLASNKLYQQFWEEHPDLQEMVFQ